MRKNFGAQSWLYPMPVLIIATYDENGVPNAMNAAWGGINDYNQITMCLSPTHKTVKNILKRKAFTVSVADAAHVIAEDYVGIVSGNSQHDKFSKAGFTETKSEFVDAPVINEIPMALECELEKVNSDGLIVGKIVNVSADESVLGANGKINPALFRPITFDAVNNQYIALGEVVGKAFSDGAKLK
ncbi:MAG: flavin reductase family protein [Clostridia bacterium]|nr:flavin reductase family protein [Clostridia bacterium]